MRKSALIFCPLHIEMRRSGEGWMDARAFSVYPCGRVNCCLLGSFKVALEAHDKMERMAQKGGKEAVNDTEGMRGEVRNPQLQSPARAQRLRLGYDG